MIEVKNVSKRYGDKYAVRDATFSVQKGEVVGFLGRNGAGKSTTMNMITGYISTTAGSISIDGYDILKHPYEAKRQIGYLPENPPLYMDMTVEEYLRFCCDVKKVNRKLMKKHLDDITELTGIGHVRGRLIRNLSKGYKQRTGLAQALVGNPEVIILDEPTVGLDPTQIIEIRTLIRRLGEDHTVILSSHILPEVSEVCEKFIVINEGRIVAQDTLANLTGRSDGRMRMQIRAKAEEKAVQSVLAAVPGVHECKCAGSKEEGMLDFMLEMEKESRSMVFEHLAASHIPVVLMKPMDESLEDIFLRLTQEEMLK
ncbi:MAG: ATP-binding cassette domain-containing protein [Clostridia bacterium]|nr:ATP-binding cassette domain-containing protein [Clostridia bacterium]